MDDHTLSNSIMIPIMVMWVVDMVFLTVTLYPNVNIQVYLRRFVMMLKSLMVMWVVGVVFYTATLSANMKIKVP